MPGDAAGGRFVTGVSEVVLDKPDRRGGGGHDEAVVCAVRQADSRPLRSGGDGRGGGRVALLPGRHLSRHERLATAGSVEHAGVGVLLAALRAAG